MDRCGFYDNGRIKTWLPYRRNEEGTGLVHEVTQKKLMGEGEEKEDLLYAEWYGGPKVNVNQNVLFDFIGWSTNLNVKGLFY